VKVRRVNRPPALPRAISSLLLYALSHAALGCSLINNPDARVNQLGYLPHSRKVAIVESSASAPLDWYVQDANGRVVANGKTEQRGPDKESGAEVHWADFSSLTVPGKGYRLVVDGGESYAFSVDSRVYKPLKDGSLAYFYHNRSGTPIEIPFAGAWQWTHGPGHMSDADVGCVNDCGYRLNVLGGWYDAGDHGKYVVNGGISVWTLLNLYERTKYLGRNLDALGDGSQNIPESSNGVSDLLDETRWEIEFLLLMQVPPGRENSGMVHHKIHDSSWTTLGRVPPETWPERYLHPPSTAATLNLAAVGAQCSRIWRDVDAEFAERCRVGAIRAWNAAQRFPKVYAPQYDNQGGGPYDDTDVSDEFYWAAAELFISLKSQELLDFLQASPHHLTFPSETGHERVKHYTSMTWQATAALGALSLLIVPDSLPDTSQRDTLRSKVIQAADGYLGIANAQGYRVPIRVGSNGHYPWGSNSLVANNALVMAVAHDLTHERKYLDGVVEGVDYLLGRNPLNLSYVSGFGENAFENPHHRFWAHQKVSSFPNPPPGALAGGPNSRLQDPTSSRLSGCAPQRCYVDHVDAWSVNEVAINWNAPLSWLATFLDEQGLDERAPGDQGAIERKAVPVRDAAATSKNAPSASDAPPPNTASGDTTTGGATKKEATPNVTPEKVDQP
jgi:endoglucanase